MKVMGCGSGGQKQTPAVGERKMDCEIGDWY